MTFVRDVVLAAFREVLGVFYESRKEDIGGSYVDDLMAALGE